MYTHSRAFRTLAASVAAPTFNAQTSGRKSNSGQGGHDSACTLRVETRPVCVVIYIAIVNVNVAVLENA